TWPGVAWARSLGRAVSGGYLELQSRSARGGGTWALKSIGDGVQKAMRDCQVPVHGQCHSDSKLLRTRVDQGETTDTLSYVRQVDSNFIKPPKTAAANLRTARYDPILIQPNRFKISEAFVSCSATSSPCIWPKHRLAPGYAKRVACPKDLDTKTKMEVFHLMRLAKIDSGSGGSAHS
ncbi:Uncharacterized protein HZ326_29397, partial [Fusarium oxysporum f. sp. albedinis]